MRDASWETLIKANFPMEWWSHTYLKLNQTDFDWFFKQDWDVQHCGRHLPDGGELFFEKNQFVLEDDLDDHDNDDNDDDGGGFYVDNGNGEVVNVEDALIMRLILRVNKGSRRRETQPPELQRSLSRWTGTMSVWIIIIIIDIFTITMILTMIIIIINLLLRIIIIITITSVIILSIWYQKNVLQRMTNWPWKSFVREAETTHGLFRCCRRP